MGINIYLPHIIVVPEDDANRQIVNGFLLESGLDERKIQVQPPAGGWPKVKAEFKNNQIDAMSKYADRYVVLLIDFDVDD